MQPVLCCRAAKERQRAESAAAEASERSAAELQAAREAANAAEKRADEAAAEAAKAAGELRDYKACWVPALPAGHTGLLRHGLRVHSELTSAGHASSAALTVAGGPSGSHQHQHPVPGGLPGQHQVLREP